MRNFPACKLDVTRFRRHISNSSHRSLAYDSSWPKADYQPSAAHITTSKPKRDIQDFCRTDYHQATPAVAALARKEHIYKEQRFSDHAPMTIDYELTL